MSTCNLGTAQKPCCPPRHPPLQFTKTAGSCTRSAQPLLQLRTATLQLLDVDRDRQCRCLSVQHDELLAACDAGSDQVAFEHHIVLCRHGDDNHRVLRPLRLEDTQGMALSGSNVGEARVPAFSRAMCAAITGLFSTEARRRRRAIRPRCRPSAHHRRSPGRWSLRSHRTGCRATSPPVAATRITADRSALRKRLRPVHRTLRPGHAGANRARCRSAWAKVSADRKPMPLMSRASR